MKARVISSLALPAALTTAGLLNTAEAAYAALGPETVTAAPSVSAHEELPGAGATTVSAERPCKPYLNSTITDYSHCCTPVANMTVTDYGHCCTPVTNMTISDYGYCCTTVANVVICDYGHHQQHGPGHQVHDYNAPGVSQLAVVPEPAPQAQPRPAGR